MIESKLEITDMLGELGLGALNPVIKFLDHADTLYEFRLLNIRPVSHFDMNWADSG